MSVLEPTGVPHSMVDDDMVHEGMVEQGVVEQMLAAMPPHRGRVRGWDRAALRECIEAAQQAAHTATVCADACLAEEMVDELVDAIRALLNTADVCEVTARVLSRHTGPDPAVARALLAACWSACRAGREVCEEFLPIHDHCRVTARACRAGERACRNLLSSLNRTMS